MILICPVRPGEVNEELRYAVRSWEANLHLRAPGGEDHPLELMVVGDCPSWLKPDIFVPGNKHTSMPINVWENVRLGAEAAEKHDGGHEAIYMNDDFFCLDPVGSILPVKRNKSLAAHAAASSTGTWWGASLVLTASWLNGLGFPHPDSYEVHRPLLASPSGMIEALSRWEGGLNGPLPQWRTTYGVLNKVEAYPVFDAKLSRSQPGVGTPWVSTSDQTWRIYAPSIKKRFQKPSRWER